MLMKPIRLGDCLVLLLILITAGLLFLASLLPKEAGKTLEVTYGDVKEQYSLQEDRELTVKANGHTLCIEIRDQKVKVLSSDCPDGVCRNSGEIEKAGETLICVPAGVLLRLVGEEAGDDAVAG